MIISFCSQVYNRLHQLQSTLYHNLEVLEGSNHMMVIVVYPSLDGTLDFVNSVDHPNLTIHVATGHYDLIAAKRLSHSLAVGDYVMNLDCDNFISNELVQFIECHYSEPIHNWSGRSKDGTFGRIGMPIPMYKELGGYPYYMSGGGVHDDVLIYAAKLLHGSVGRGPSCIRPIQNSKDDTCVDWADRWLDNLTAYCRTGWYIPPKDIILQPHSVGPTAGLVLNIPALPQSDQIMEHCLRYQVRFDAAFDFGNGGKLPGWGSGNPPPTGGRSLGGWSVRVMWRCDGAAEAYAYFPGQPSQCGTSFPIDFKFSRGTNHTITMHFMNEKVTVSVDGNSVVLAVPPIPPTTLLYHVFREGHDATWSTPSSGVVSIRPPS